MGRLWENMTHLSLGPWGATWACVASVSGVAQWGFAGIIHWSVLLHHVRMVSSISSLESATLAIFFKERRWHSDRRSLLAESRMAVILWITGGRKEWIIKRMNMLYGVSHSRESAGGPAWFRLLGAAAAGWRWCARSELGRWCSCPWCCPADSSAAASWQLPPWEELPGLWRPTIAPALTPVWCHWTGSEDTVGVGVTVKNRPKVIK